MFDQPDDAVERMARHLRQPVRIDPALDERVMRAIATLPTPVRSTAGVAWSWLTRPRRLTLTPLGMVAAAAALAAVVLLYRRGPGPPVLPRTDTRTFQFVLVAPRATRVSLVGDFNDWDATRTPMRRVRATSSLWSTLIPLAPGRYRYSFLVDGAHWRADPAAPAARDDEFGTPSSVVTVGGS